MVEFSRIPMICLLSATLLVACGGSPQSKFEDELNDKFDELIAKLEAYAAGDTSEDAAGTASWYDEGQLMMNTDASLPTDRSWFIISLAEEIQEHFSYVSLEFLNQDPADLDAWGSSFQQRYDARRAGVQALLDEVEERYRANPDDYYSPLYSLGGGLGMSPDDRLYFMRGDRGYFIAEMIDIDIDAWLAAVNEQMLELQ